MKRVVLKNGKTRPYWFCRCDCGTEKFIDHYALVRKNKGATRSCGCVVTNPGLKGTGYDLRNQKFGKWVVDDCDPIRKNRGYFWKCTCECGSKGEILQYNLTSGQSTSCGCYRREVMGALNFTHGMSRTRIYRIWGDMKSRCTNPNFTEYENYGGRGISICEEWANSFETFKEWALDNGYSENLTIDRIDNNGNYCPENCRWITLLEQANNTRANKHISLNGETHTISEWSRIFDVNPRSFRDWVKIYKSEEDILRKVEEYKNKKGPRPPV